MALLRHVDLAACVLATLDALATSLYVQIDDFLPTRHGAAHPPRISDSELITLAVCQMLLGLLNDQQLLALARYRLGHLLPHLPKQPARTSTSARW